MSIPFIPLTLLFIVALTVMLVGLRLSSRTLTADRREIEDTSYRRGTRQGRPSRNVSTYDTTNTCHLPLKQVESYAGSRDYKNPGKVGGILARNKFVSETCTILRDLMIGTRRELISSQSKGKYTYVTSRRSFYGWFLFFLTCGLVFSGSVVFLYRELNSISSNPLFMLQYQSAANSTPTAAHIQIPQGVSGASKVLKRLAQMDASQYTSEQQYDTWAPSACSTTAMTEVINAYGHNYHISDILQAEIGQSAISPELGLLKLEGIDHTVAQFGFGTAQLSRAPLDSIISVANSGWPIIVDFPPSGDWPTGHFLVVIGGDSSTVLLADSSSSNFTSMSRQQFSRDWGGYAVVVMPKGQ
ncbi:MAG TPA: cysteine peptidase family C39 domain-containing protein [Ktedonobacteraceae bacterium]